MRRIMLVTTMAAALAAVATARPVSYDLPPEVAELAAGPGLEGAQANCVACHSADYIATQPRNLRDPAGFWTAEVNKMRHAYGAPIEEADVKAIVAYLVAVYGR